MTNHDRIVRRLQQAGIEATELHIHIATNLLGMGRRLGEACCGAVVNDASITDAQYRCLSRQPALDRD